MGLFKSSYFIGKAALIISFCAAAFHSQAPSGTSIRVEAMGRLEFEEGRGYFVQVDAKRFPENKNRIWLSFSEDKVTVRKLAPLLCKEVIIRGELEQLPDDVTAATPPHGMFVTDFDIEAVQPSATIPKCSYPAIWFARVNDPNKPDWEILPQKAKAGEVILSKRNELGILSNFAATPLELDGKRYASVEGFWQMMLYPEGPDDPRAKDKSVVWKFTREQVAQMTAFDAKAAGTLAEENMKTLGIDWCTYKGKKFPYRSAKPGEHYRLIIAAMRAKLEQNPDVKRILLATGDLKLRPDHIEEENAPPEWRYYEIWMQLRAERQKP